MMYQTLPVSFSDFLLLIVYRCLLFESFVVRMLSVISHKIWQKAYFLGCMMKHI